MPEHIINGRFQILLRRRQIQAIYPEPDGAFQNVIVQCDPLTGAAQYIPGTVDNTSPFVFGVNNPVVITPVNSWYDFSNYIEGEQKLSLSWDKTNSGDSKNSEASQDGSNYDKGITSDLMFFDAAQQFIDLWLLNTQCQILNCVEVKIIDLIARGNNPDPSGNYRLFEIKSDNIEEAPVDEPCKFFVKLREQDNIWHCVHKTVIWDNWQNWFNEDKNNPSTFQHPTFLTCIEPRPRIVSSVRMGLLMFVESFPAVFVGAKIKDKLTGEDPFDVEARRILGADKFVDAPLVRTYIQNVAGKCGMTWDTIFDVGQDWENLCTYFPQAGQMKETNSEGDPISPDQLFSFENRWVVTLADYLDKLKLVFASEWYVTPLNKIVFKYTKDLLQLDPIYDYTAVGAEPIYGLRYTFDGNKKAAYGDYQYADDGSDLASQEINVLYSDIIDFDGSANNPMLEGDITKSFEFASTGFVRDGRSKDYMRLLINDGKIIAWTLLLILAVVAFVFLPGLTFYEAGALAIGAITWAALAQDLTNEMRQEFISPIYDGAVRLTCEQTMMPRLLLWDGLNIQQAKTEARIGMPVPNPYYNPANIQYNVKNDIGVTPDGVTTDKNPTGAIYNYPMYIDGDFYSNLFKFHDPIDNPLKSIETHRHAKFYVDLCEAQLNLYGVFQDQYAQIGKIIKVEHKTNYDVYVRIQNITVDYDSEQIQISGVVIRKPVESIDDLGEGNIPVVTPEESVPPIEPGDVCFKWLNDSDEDAVVNYKDCVGAIISSVVAAHTHLCAIQIYSYAGGNLVATDTCEEISGSVPSGGSGGSGGSGAANCIRYMNLVTDTITGLSYKDCDGNIIAGVDLPFMGVICATEIINPGSCGSIAKLGICNPCNPCCAPEIISVELGFETPAPCTPVDVLEFSLPDGFVGVPYEFRVTLNPADATPPFVVTPSDIPSWMTITIDEDTNELVISGTPDATCDGCVVSFTYTNCGGGGSQEIGGFITVLAVDAGVDQSIYSPDTTVQLDGSTICTGGTYLWTTSGDGSFDDATILNPVYTVGSGDIAAHTVTLTLTVSGSSCGGDQSDSMVVTIFNFFVTYTIATIDADTEVNFSLNRFTGTGVGFIDWGDGTTETVPEGLISGSHVYATPGDYIILVYTQSNDMTSFFATTPGIGTTQVYGWSATGYNQGVIVLSGIMNTPACWPTVSQNLSIFQLIAHPDNTETTLDMSGFQPQNNNSGIDFENYPLLESVINVPPSIVSFFKYGISVQTCPNFDDFDSGNSIDPTATSNLTLQNNKNGITYGTLDLSQCSRLTIAQDLDVTRVNDLLVALDANGINNGNCYLRQIPTAAPTGAGATAKTNLIGKGWTVTTD